jgi:hypothetical protein
MKFAAPRCIVVFFVILCSAHALEWEQTVVSVTPKAGADVVLATFAFKNTSSTKVRVLGITTSCSCTEAQPSASEIPAGGSGQIEALFTIGQRHGPQEKEITVLTDESKTPIKLVLKVDLPAGNQSARK